MKTHTSEMIETIHLYRTYIHKTVDHAESQRALHEVSTELTFTKLSIMLSLRGLFMRSCSVWIASLEVCRSDTIVAE
jgi:hypothetical protein